LIPSGIAMFFNLYWAPTRLNPYFALYLFCALLLVVRRHVRVREWRWQARGIGYKPDIGYHFLRAGAIFSLLVLLAVWSLPIAGVNARLVAVWERFRDPWQGLGSHWNRLYAALNYYPTQPAGFSPSNRSLELGGPLQLSDDPLVDIWAENCGYWRAEVYDTYTGRNWVNTDRYLTSLRAGAPLSRSGYKLRREVKQTVRLLRGGTNLIYVSSQPLRVSLPLWVVLGSSSIENVLTLYSLSDLETDQTYTVVSSVSQADVDSLRGAGNEYPAWVADRYLQLPATLPRRVRILAQNLTRRYDNAYDQIEALERYLRRIPYNDGIEAPPEGQDSVDYFLFEARQGYCSYYASALVVMARALGIAARPVSGYKCERYRAETGAYRVLESDAHAWAEVYFPNYGWIEIEPTPSEPLLKRPGHKDETQTEPKNDKMRERLQDDRMSGRDWDDIDLSSGLVALTRWGSEKRTVYWIGMGTLFLALAGGGTLLWWRRRENQRTLNGAEQAYASLLRWSSRLGLDRQASQTPHEHASILAQALPQGQEPLRRLVALYVKARFGAAELNDLEQAGARRAWHRLRPILRAQLWRQKLRLPWLWSRLRSD
jgi:transglutaminase-like putative cysteine protease